MSEAMGGVNEQVLTPKNELTAEDRYFIDKTSASLGARERKVYDLLLTHSYKTTPGIQQELVKSGDEDTAKTLSTVLYNLRGKGLIVSMPARMGKGVLKHLKLTQKLLHPQTSMRANKGRRKPVNGNGKAGPERLAQPFSQRSQQQKNAKDPMTRILGRIAAIESRITKWEDSANEFSESIRKEVEDLLLDLDSVDQRCKRADELEAKVKKTFQNF